MPRLLVRVLVVALVACGSLLGCHGSPSGPGEGPLANGRWTGEGACLSVTDSGCNLAVGCGHGQFPRPTVRADGTFDVDGTYRIEVGPHLGCWAVHVNAPDQHRLRAIYEDYGQRHHIRRGQAHDLCAWTRPDCIGNVDHHGG